MCTETADCCRARQTFPSYSTAFPLLFKYSCSSVGILPTKQTGIAMRQISSFNVLKPKLLEGVCSLNLNPLVASNMSATRRVPASSRGRSAGRSVCLTVSLTVGRAHLTRLLEVLATHEMFNGDSGQTCPSFVLNLASRERFRGRKGKAMVGCHSYQNLQTRQNI